MTPLSPDVLLAALRLTFRQPRAAARWLMDLGLADGPRWVAFTIVAIFSALTMSLAEMIAPPSPEMGDPSGAVALPPLVWVGMLGLGMLVTTGLVTWVGRLFGGTGRFAQAQVLVIWLQLVQVIMVLAQIVALFLLPPVAVTIDILSIAVVFWLMSAFVAELHGFRYSFLVFLGILGTGLALAFVLALMLVPFVQGAGA